MPHTLRIPDEEWKEAERMAQAHREEHGVRMTATNVLLSLLRQALDTKQRQDKTGESND